MIIRQAQMADLDAIYAIELENFSPEEAVSRESLAAHIQTLSSTFLVAEKDTFSKSNTSSESATAICLHTVERGMVLRSEERV